jgi:lysophospholipase L1-like esterase
VVAFGDSVTDGFGSTLDDDQIFPNNLNRRLREALESSNVAVVNAGISGNRLLFTGTGASTVFGLSGLKRFDRDALAQPGVTYIVLLEGLNDIAFPGAKLGEQYLADSR